MKLLEFAVIAALSTPVFSWESGPEPGGPDAARALLSALPSTPRNEHAELLVEAMRKEGFPPLLYSSEPFTLTIYANTNKEVINEPEGSSVDPVKAKDFAKISSVQQRNYTIPGFASLPDHSYSITDWVRGNEKCPTGTYFTETQPSPQECHDFRSHMGAVNSNHFMPQAKKTYARYHTMALQRAAACKELVQKVFVNSEQFSPDQGEMVTNAGFECEREALAIEAFGQHFLQDAFSIGHMWQRWGAPDARKFSDHEYTGYDYLQGDEAHQAALIVAATSGILHGTEVLLDIPDNLSSGGSKNWANELLSEFGESNFGVGDHHLDELLSDPKYAVQANLLLDCSGKGLREVYEATDQVHGSISVISDNRVNVLENEDCWSSWATNEAMLGAFDIHPVASVFGITLDSWLARWIVPHVAISGTSGAPVSSPLKHRYQYDTIRSWAKAAQRAQRSPLETDLAKKGIVGSFMGISRNEDFTRTPPAVYSDPEFPWPFSLDSNSWDADGSSERLAMAFHSAHTDEWCDFNLVAAERDFGILQADRGIGNVLSDSKRTARAKACVAFLSPRIRLNGNPSVCDILHPENSSDQLHTALTLTHAAGGDVFDAAQLVCDIRPDIQVAEAITHITDITTFPNHTTVEFERKLFDFPAVEIQLPFQLSHLEFSLASPIAHLIPLNAGPHTIDATSVAGGQQSFSEITIETNEGRLLSGEIHSEGSNGTDSFSGRSHATLQFSRVFIIDRPDFTGEHATVDFQVDLTASASTPSHSDSCLNPSQHAQRDFSSITQGVSIRSSGNGTSTIVDATWNRDISCPWDSPLPIVPPSLILQIPITYGSPFSVYLSFGQTVNNNTFPTIKGDTRMELVGPINLPSDTIVRSGPLSYTGE